MREILFKGKSKGTGLWVEGDLNHHKDGRRFIRFWCAGIYTSVEVEPETVGQYTCLTDKRGKKIFGGDLILVGGAKEPVLVEFEGFSWECTSKAIGPYYRHRLEDNSSKYEVVGNIHDDEELLNKGRKDRRISMERESAKSVRKNKCDDCIHNVGTDTLNCGLGCAGVTAVEDEGRTVVFCEDYECDTRKSDQNK